MSDFKLGGSPEFAAAWREATKDGKIEFAELKKLAQVAQSSEDKADDELVGRLIKDQAGITSGDFSVQQGAAEKRVSFIDGMHSVAIAPDEVTPDNVTEFVFQRVDRYEKAVAALDPKDPQLAEKKAALKQELLDKDLKAALDRIIPPGSGGEIPVDQAEVAMTLLRFLAD